MQRLRQSTRVARALAAGLLVFATLVPVAGQAQTAPGESALREARSSWDRGLLARAATSYREAIEKGGLAPADVLEGYVRLGAIRAVTGKKDAAIAAFRAASVLDASFTVPPNAGKKGRALADKAKKDTAKIGSINLTLKAPKEIIAGKAFKITATLDKPHVAIVQKIAVVAKDGTTGKESTAEAPPDESVELEVGPEVTLPGSSIVVRVDALDGFNNRLASAEERVRVPDDKAGAVAPPVIADSREPVRGPSASSSSSSSTRSSAPGKDAGPQTSKGSFWSSPWPYVIGGVAIASAGTAVYFGTRPSDDVSVGQIGVRTR